MNYLSNSGKLSFWEWSEKIYSPEELNKNFKLNFFKILIDKILQRE